MTSSDDVTALIATLSTVTNLNKLALGVTKLLTMLRSQFGQNLFRTSAEQKQAERLLAAKTTTEEKRILASAEFDRKEYALLREERLRQIKKALKAGKVSLRKEDIIAVDVLCDPEGEALSPTSSDKRPFEYVEEKQIRNIKQVTREAVNAMPLHAEISEASVDDDWVARLFDTVKDVSNEDMQRIWGRLLAGEIAKPGSFSLRTIDVLRNLSQQEAKLFERITAYATTDNWIYHFDHLGLEEEIKFFRGNLTRLAECGLLNDQDVYSVGGSQVVIDEEKRPSFVYPDVKEAISYDGVELLLDFSHCENYAHMRAYSLTVAGRELRATIGRPTDLMYVRFLCDFLAAKGLPPKVVEDKRGRA